MFTPEQISQVEQLLAEGLSPEQIAESLDFTLSQFRVRLSNSGYRVVIRRELEPIRPVGLAEREPVEAVAA